MSHEVDRDSLVASSPAMTPQQRRLSSGGLAAYREMAVGGSGLPFWLSYELVTTLFSRLPGVLGFGARATLFPFLFGTCGARPAIGSSVLLRNPRRIVLGSRVLIDDFVALDVRGDDATIRLHDRVSVGRFSSIVAKHGEISLGAGTNIGSYCRIATQSKLIIGESVLVSAFCYIGPGNHVHGPGTQQLIEREMDIRGGVVIGDYAWIGAKATILDGVSIGKNAIVGAHSLVLHDVPDGAIVAGTPAKVIGENQPVAPAQV